MRFRSALLLAVVLLAAGCGGDGSASEEPAMARKGASPDTTIAGGPLLQRADFDLQNYEGQVVLLNFWATWCAPCRQEMPDLVQLQEELGDQGLQIIGIALDQGGKEAVAPYLERQPVNYPVVTDADGEIAEEYGGVAALPTTFVIGRDGRVQERIVGRVRADQLRGRLEDVLAGEGSAPDSSSATRKAPGGRPGFIKSALPRPPRPRRPPGGSARARS